MFALVLAVGLVGQSGLVDNGFDVPTTLSFSNPLSGSANVQLTYTSGQGWRGSDANGAYKLTGPGFRAGGTYFVLSWHLEIMTPGANGQYDMFRSGAGLGWSLQGTGMKVSP